MSERRVEKLRAIEEDRAKRLKELAQGPDQLESLGVAKVDECMDDLCCGLKPSGSGARDKEKERERDTGLGMDDGEVKMEDGDGDGGEGGLRRKNGRQLR